ncbi:MAG: molybdopterin-guanine dinucleotide biosynthesis protein B [Desulfobulbaceae bacterium]|jgi:molybdopterin-guanine dinucleotide biosynthesis protein B|nr:molybdopterin-guanine dinucleotide biosynthesis protein B [Desulfobulbaceae bacterium]
MPPVLAFIGKPNCGKTTLIEKLIPALADKGVRVGTIKHHHGEIQMDTPGKDTWRHKQAGAQVVLLSSPVGIGLIQDTAEDTPVEDLVSRHFQNVDLVVVEGYKWSTLPKIEVFRSAVYDEPMQEPGETLIAMVSDVEIRQDLPWFKYDEIGSLVEFILEKIVNQ